MIQNRRCRLSLTDEFQNERTIDAPPLARAS